MWDHEDQPYFNGHAYNHPEFYMGHQLYMIGCALCDKELREEFEDCPCEDDPPCW